MKKLSLVLLSTFTLASCAGSSQLVKKTAFSVGADERNVEVSNVSHGFFETTYNAKINGRLHNCTAVGGNPFTFGVAVSPNCIAISGNSQMLKNNSCNAMLKAAGRCK